MSFSLDRLQYFASVVECGSFTDAAQSLGVAKNVVSHQVAALEKELSATLLLRTTRNVTPTKEGAQFYQKISGLLRDAEQAAADLNQNYQAPTGVLRITAPVHFGTKVVVPSIKEYLQRYPHMKVDLSLADHISDLITDNFDLSIRVGWLKDSSNIMRKIADVRRFPVATPALSEPLYHPRALTNLPAISFALSEKRVEHTFTRADETATVALTPVLRTDTTEAMQAAVLNGIGVAIMSDFQVADDLKAARLQRLLPDWSLANSGIYAQYPPSKYRVAKSVCFVDTMRDYYKRTFNTDPILS